MPRFMQGQIRAAGHVIRCGHVSGLSIRPCGCRRPSWRYAEQAQINSASFSLLEPRCFSWSRSVRSFALAVHDLLTCPPLLIPRAILFAKASATKISGLRSIMRLSHEPGRAPRRDAHRITAMAVFEVRPSRCLPPVEC